MIPPLMTARNFYNTDVEAITPELKPTGEAKRIDWLDGKVRVVNGGRLVLNGTLAYPVRKSIKKVCPRGYEPMGEHFAPIVPECRFRSDKDTSCCTKQFCSWLDDFVERIDCHVCEKHETAG